jgi:micrococcal nuclease
VRIAAAVLALAGACTAGDAASPCGPTHAVVERVIDGDTIVLAGGAKVRYLLVDANETTDGHADCFGAQARSLNQSLVEGKAVDLAYDEQCQDKYGRLLAYVSVDGRDVGSLLVEGGYACVLYIPPDGVERRDELEALEAQARAARAGMWGACPVVACAE